MEESYVFALVGQFVKERGYTDTLKALETESGRKYAGHMLKKSEELQAILDEHAAMEKQRMESASCVTLLFPPGEQTFANKLYCSFDDVTGGLNVIVVKLIENGVLAFGTPKSQLGTIELPLPLSPTSPPVPPIATFHVSSSESAKGAILSIDFHPKHRNLLVCGSMNRLSLLVDIDQTDEPVVQTFADHTKYVVRTLWSPSGKYFITGSYDHTICLYKNKNDSLSEYEFAQRIEMNGAVEGLTFVEDEDVFVVGCRNDYLLHCFDLSSGRAVETRKINMNALGDDFVSFVAMHLTFSPDGKYILVSTGTYHTHTYFQTADRDRLVLYAWETGKQITSFYGAYNDEYSQPRHCWDPSGRYIYGTSQDDNSIVVWEIRSQSIVARLTGHTGTVRDIHFCAEMGVLVSCGFDGTIKLWRTVSD